MLRDRVRVEIIRLLTTKWCATDPAFCIVADNKNCEECYADQIMAIKELAVVDRDAELPDKVADEINELFDIWALRPLYAKDLVTKVLDDAGWVKEEK